MPKIERRISTCLVKLETRAEGEPKKITGYGAMTYDGTPGTEYVLWDYGSERCVERILPGAFDKCISRPDDVRGLFNHDANQVLGRTAAGTMKLAVDAKGLLYDIDPGDTTTGRDVSVHLNRGDVSGSSIAFIVDEERWTETKDADGKWNVLREILSVTLYDTGPVTFPAYEATTASLRAAGDPEEAKRSLQTFRDKQPSGDNMDLKKKLATYRRRADQAIQRAAMTTEEARASMSKSDLMTACCACVKSCQSCTDTCRECVDACTAMPGTPSDEEIAACQECIRFCQACVKACGQCLESCQSMVAGR